MSRAYAKLVGAKCRDCIYHPSNGGTWREQVTLCTATGCPLWIGRPLAENIPDWLTARDPIPLPDGWIAKAHDQALNVLRKSRAGSQDGQFSHHQTTNTTDPLPHTA